MLDVKLRMGEVTSYPNTTIIITKRNIYFRAQYIGGVNKVSIYSFTYVLQVNSRLKVHHTIYVRLVSLFKHYICYICLSI